MEQQKLPNSTLILILGILSLPMCCCSYGVIGLILGVVVIVLANKAAKVYAENPEAYTGFQNVKTGKILAIIGIVLAILYIIIIIISINIFGWDTLQDQELLQERLQEMLGQ